MLLLIAYFWHFVRPALALSLDPYLKQDLLDILHIRGYGSLSTVGITTNLQARENSQQTPRPQRPATFIACNQDVERLAGKWKIVAGVKRAFTKTFLGQNTTNTMSNKNSFLIIPLTEIDMSTLNENGKTPFISSLNSATDMDNSIDEEISSP